MVRYICPICKTDGFIRTPNEGTKIICERGHEVQVISEKDTVCPYCFRGDHTRKDLMGEWICDFCNKKFKKGFKSKRNITFSKKQIMEFKRITKKYDRLKKPHYNAIQKLMQKEYTEMSKI